MWCQNMAGKAERRALCKLPLNAGQGLVTQAEPHPHANAFLLGYGAGISQHTAKDRQHWIIALAKIQFSRCACRPALGPRAARRGSVQDQSQRQ